MADATDGASRVCEALCRILREGVDIHRCLAAQALGRIAHPGAVETLVEALVDEDEDVRIDAAKALRRFSDSRAAKQLLENLLGDPCGDVKLYAIEALARARHPELAPWLRRLLKGRDEAIVWDEEEFYADGWDNWIDIQTKAIDALAELGFEDAVDDIVEALDDEFGQDLTEVGFRALAVLGDRGISALARYLDDPSERRRRRAAAALAGTDAEAAYDAVVRALGDASLNVRLAAARGLVARNLADERLAALFRDARSEVRAEIVRICGRSHPDRLEALLDDKAPVVCRAVLEVVTCAPELLPADHVAERSRAWLRGADAEMASAAGLALAAVDPIMATDELVAQLADRERPLAVRLAAVKGLTRIGGETALQALADAVGDDQRQMRIEVMAALAAFSAADTDWPNLSGETLLAALRGELIPQPSADTEADVEHVADGDDRGRATPEAREATSEAREATSDSAFPTSTLESMLGDGPSASPTSIEDLEDTVLTDEDMEFLALSKRTLRRKNVPVTPTVAPYQDVRRLAARVLGDLDHEEVARALAENLEDRDEDVRRAAADSLARIADRLKTFPAELVDALLTRLTNSDRDMRLSIVRALGAAGGQAAGAALVRRLRDDDGFVRTEAVRALSRLGAGEAEIEARLTDPDPGVRSAAAQAVAEAGGARAVDMLVDFAFAFGGHHRHQAGRLLRGLNVATASTRFLDILDDQRRQGAWQIAIEALDELHRSEDAATLGTTAQT